MAQPNLIITTDIDCCLTAPNRDFDYWPPVMPGAQSGIRLLKLLLDAEFVAITSRPPQQSDITRAWLDENFPNLIPTVIHSELYRHRYWPYLPLASYKGLVARDLGASVHIDDTPLHIAAALDYQVELPVLFGLYRWNVDAKLPAPAVHAPRWPEVCYEIFGRFRHQF
ncbi:hypothetical protein FWG86_02185 [Candidatus Saccharibacteria bacterium]|nr:hypothetical protein [Candidatus Saccharibacteria bacterium]